MPKLLIIMIEQVNLQYFSNFEQARNIFNTFENIQKLQIANLGQIYTTNREWQKATECHLIAAEYHLDNGSLFYAAHSYQYIIYVQQGMQNWVEVTEVALLVANLLPHERASIVLVNVAKKLEMEYPAGALELYHHATIRVSLESQWSCTEYADYHVY